MIGTDFRFDPNATPPQWVGKDDIGIVERGSHVRVKIKGIRGEVGQMFAIATIKEVMSNFVSFADNC